MKTIDRREFVIGAAALAILPTSIPSVANAITPSHLTLLNYARMMRDYLDYFRLSVHEMLEIEPGSKMVKHDGRSIIQLHVDHGENRPFVSAEVRLLAKMTYRYVRWRRRNAVRFMPLIIPSKGLIEAHSIVDAQIPIRVLSAYDMHSDGVISRMDVLFEVL